MKSFTFPLDTHAINVFFSPIREKRNLIYLLINAVKYMLINQPIDSKDVSGTVCLNIDKMSRLFFFTDKKYFSFNFPFRVQEKDGGLQFYSIHIDSIDNKVTSEILSILKSEKIQGASCIMDFATEFVDETDYSEKLWMQFIDLLGFEDGYIRFDHDPQREEGKLHPLNHLDVFYSNGSTFKLGTENKLSEDGLVDLLNLKSNCSYLVNA